MTSLVRAIAAAGSVCLAFVPRSLSPEASQTPDVLLRLETGGHTSTVWRTLWAGPNLVASVGHDKVVRLWNLKTGEGRAIRFPIGLDLAGTPQSAAISSSGMLAVGVVGEAGQPARVFLIDTKSAKMTGAIDAHRGAVTALSFSPDGKMLASGGTDGALSLWELSKSDKPKASFTVGEAPAWVPGVAFAPDGKRVAYCARAGGRSLVGIAEVGKWQLPKEARSFDKPLQNLDWGKGDLIAVAGAQGLLALMKPGGEPEMLSLPATDGAYSVDIDEEGRHLAVAVIGASEGRTEMWDLRTKAKRWQTVDRNGPIAAVAISKDGARVVSGGGSASVFVLDAATGAIASTFQGSGRAVGVVGWSPDSKIVAWGHEVGLGRYRPTADLLEKAFDLLGCFPAEVPSGATAGSRPVGGRRTEWNEETKKVEIKDASGQVICAQGQARNTRPNAYGMVTENLFVMASDRGRLALYRVGQGAAQLVGALPGPDGEVLSVAPSPDGKFLAAGSNDQTVRIYSIAEIAAATPPVLPRPLLSIFVGSDGKWVEWNDEKGVYYASPNGDDIVQFQKDNGPAASPEMMASSQRRDYCKPDVLKAVVAAGDSKPVAQVPSIVSSLKNAPRLNLIRVEGARMTDEGTWETASRKVKLVVAADNYNPESSRIEARVGNAPDAKDIRRSRNAPKQHEEVEAELYPGENNVRLVLKDLSSGALSPNLDVKVLCTAPETPNEQGKLHILSVGISEYIDPGVDKLSFAAVDAAAFANFYKSNQAALKGVYSDIQVKSIVNQEATRANILAGLEAFKGPQIGRGDTVVLFVSSHGEAVAEGSQGAYYLITHDADLSKLKETGLGWDAVVNVLKDIRCRNVIVVADNCFSGGLSRSLARNYNWTNDALRDINWETNIITFTGSTANEKSYEDDRWGHGAFTYALLQALNGKLQVRPDDDGRILLGAISYPVQELVMREVREKKGRSITQTPMLFHTGSTLRIPVAKAG